MPFRERADQQATHGVERLENRGVVERVRGTLAVRATDDNSDSPHYAEMLGEVRLLYSQFAGQFAHRPFAIPQGVEDAQASRMTDGSTELGVQPIRLFRGIHRRGDVLILQ